MMSQTHLLISSSLFAKPGGRLRNTAVLVGAFLPDFAIYVLFAWSKWAGIDENRVWRELYWQEPWQSWTAAGNSLPLYFSLLLIGVILLRIAGGVWRVGLFLTFLALAALVHIAGDLPVHVQDAHRHLWPFSNWKFVSPVSYWDPDYHGNIFAVFEFALGIALAIILYRRFHNRILRLILLLMIVAYVGVPAYYRLVLGGG